MSEPRPGTLDFSARASPQGEAVIDGQIRRSWAEWEERACRLGSFLRDRFEIGIGDRVAWMSFNDAAYFDLSYALMKIGAVGVPVGYRLTGSEAAYIVDNSDAKAVICGREFAERLGTAREEMPGVPRDRFLVIESDDAARAALPGAIDLEEAVEQGSPEIFPAHEHQTGSIIYTSGTTGRPKGAFRDGFDENMQAGLQEFMMGVVTGFGYALPDKHLLCCPLYHSAPPAIANITHLLSGPVVVQRRFDAEGALRLIQEEQISSTFMVPTMLNRIAALPEEVASRYDLSSMKRLIVGAAPFPAPLKHKIAALFPNPCVHEFYGATETGINTIMGPQDLLRKPDSCGKLCPGNQIRILNDEGVEVPTGEIGILYVKSPILISGYHKNRKATEESMIDDFFTCGDMARVDEEGFYYIVDRKQDMIISGGVNIYPAEIEQVLREHPALYDCAVIGVPNEEWGEEVKAVVQLREGEGVATDELHAFVSERLADYKRPRSIDIVDELPYNPSGKLLKKELRRRYWEAAGRSI
jgi:fatty-acyl-CoA synthase/long-chain acyl-CoA synthetase